MGPKKNREDRVVRTDFQFLMRTPENDERVHIPTINIKDVYKHDYKQSWMIYKEGINNRFFSRHGYEKIASLSFDKKVESTAVKKLLLKGISIRGEAYSFLGCSSSGLKEMKCYMWQGTPEEVQEILNQDGEFEAITTVSKRLAGISLLFSAVTLTDVKVPEDRVICSEDIEENCCNFSDGCGGIGQAVAKKVFSRFRGRYDDETYLPSVYQVRFQGCKGVLALDNRIDPTKILIRPSMRKFSTKQYPFIGVCDYSKPYTFGHLHKQFIMLLSGLGIRDSVFEEKQSEHFRLLKTMLYDPESAITVLQWQNQFDTAQIIVKAGNVALLKEQQMSDVLKRLKNIQRKLIKKVKKLTILIHKSRYIFGICDPSGTLEYGECFLRITEKGKPKTVRGKVVVCKTPCYLLGDVRVLEAVDETDKADVSQLHHLVDCIVFPSRGCRPHPKEIAGSDLDGDKYFVTWDENLIPRTSRCPYDYPDYKPPPEGPVSIEKIIIYFSKQNETRKMITRVSKYFNKYADMRGVDSPECERLGQLFSRIIDAAKSGEQIPDRLTPPGVHEGSQKVWSRMESEACKFKKQFKSENHALYHKEVTEEFVTEIAQQQYSNISEFEKFRFILYHARLFISDDEVIIKYMLDNFIDHINFAMFSVCEKRCALDVGVPREIVINALNKSKILSEDELEYFRNDTAASPWSRIIAKEQITFEWRHLVKTITTNDYVLLVMKFPKGVKLELQFLEKQAIGQKQKVSPGSVSAIFYSEHFGYRLRYILEQDYYLDFTDNTLQLYRKLDPRLTFVWMKATKSKNTKRGRNRRVEDKGVCLLSVDLQRFNRRIFTNDRPHPRITKELFCSIEMYAQRKDESASYWDTIDVNDSLPVLETVVQEEEECEETQTDFEQLFPATDFANKDEDVFESEMLHRVAQTGNPHWFRAQLQRSRESGSTEKIGSSLSLFLSKIVEMVVPRSLPESLRSVIIEIVTAVRAGVLNDPGCVLSVAGYLFRLHLVDIAEQVVLRACKEGPLSLGSVMDILKDWQSLWYLDGTVAKTFLSKLMVLAHLTKVEAIHQGDGDQHQESEVMEHSIAGEITPSQGEDSLLERWKCRYISYYGLLHALSMISEADNQKVLSGDNETQRCVGYLKLNKTVHQESDTVSFFRSHSLRYNIRIKTGLYVAISRHRDIEEHGFPGSVCCLGQVIKLQYAPFAISVKLPDATCMPSIVSESLSSENWKYWRVDLIANIATYIRVTSAFEYFTDVVPQDNILSYLIHPTGHSETLGFHGEQAFARFPKVGRLRTVEEIDHGDLNVAQAEAVLASLQNDITLVQGPPGTGKTKVACHVIKLINLMQRDSGEQGRKPVLVVAETNVAVDNLARRLKEHLLIVRIGSVDGVAPDLYDVSLKRQMELIAEREAKKTEFRDGGGGIRRNTRLMNEVISSAEVVLTTCAGAGDVSLKDQTFELVLVDEATQTMETTLLCSLAHGAKRLVMIGDPKQLRPVVPQMKVDRKQQTSPKLDDLSNSLFHRLYNVIPTCLLDTQYRMHLDIMEFPSREFYDGKLKAEESLAERPSIIFPWPGVGETARPLCLIDVDGKESRMGTSFYNTEEFNVVQEVVDILLNVDEEKSRENGIGIGDVAILTLYQGQVRELRNSIEHQVAISTVDGFQGQEKDVIVVSTVRCNEEKVLGFSGDVQRINVVLTRAKRGLIVVGNSRTLRASETWKKWIDQAPKLEMSDLKSVATSHRRQQPRAERGAVNGGASSRA